MRGITHIFFDLDHTLWDYDFNARKVLRELYQDFRLADHTKTSEEGFITLFFQINARLWHAYNQGEIDRTHIREERFKKVMKACDGPEELADALSNRFLHECPRQPRTMPGAEIALGYLQKKYGLSIITNGFDDVQSVKLKSCRLHQYFPAVFTSETSGHRKPDPQIFYHALKVVNARPEQTLMIGDNPSTDIQGARNAGIEPVLYNPSGKMKSDCTYQVEHLTDLLKLL